MDQPEEFAIHGHENKACKIDKFMYGLKQVPKHWPKFFDNLIILNGYKVNESNKNVYYKSENGICIIICLDVDDLLIFGSNFHVVNDI